MSRYECRVGRIEADITTFWFLGRMSWIATKLYNVALWNAKETWKNTGKIPTGFDLQKVVLANKYHSYLPAHTYQHPAHQVGNSFKSWYKRRKSDVTARPPGYRLKESLSTIMFDAFWTVDNNTIRDCRIAYLISPILAGVWAFSEKTHVFSPKIHICP